MTAAGVFCRLRLAGTFAWDGANRCRTVVHPPLPFVLQRLIVEAALDVSNTGIVQVAIGDRILLQLSHARMMGGPLHWPESERTAGPHEPISVTWARTLPDFRARLEMRPHHVECWAEGELRP